MEICAGQLELAEAGPESLQHQKSQDDIHESKSPRSHRSNGSDTGGRPTTSYKKRTASVSEQQEQPAQPPDGATVLGEGPQQEDVAQESSTRKSARPTPSRSARPGSAIKSARPRQAPPSGRAGQRLSAARPPSARPAAPRLKEKTDVAVVEEEAIR